MIKMTMGAAVAAIALTAAAPSFAATTVVPLVAGPSGSQSGGFEITGLGAGAFMETFLFTLPEAGTTAASIITIAANAATNVNFTSATLNGVALSLSPNGVAEFGSVTLATLAGQQTLIVNGTSGGNGSFGGNISFAPGAVPEPATWALMILGFGMVGGMMRRRASTPSNVAVRFAA